MILGVCMRKLLSLFIACIMTLSLSVSAFATEKELVAVLYYSSTVGGNLIHTEKYIGADYLSALVKSEREKFPATFLFDLGDAVQGSVFVNSGEGQVAVDVMNAVGYDGMVLGNREFDYGFERLLELADAANFPFFTQEVIVANNTELESSAIIEHGGVKIGVFGLTSPSVKYVSTAGHDRDYGTVAELISYSADTAANLRANGADIVVCLMELGVEELQFQDYGTAMDIGDNVLGIDIILDAHEYGTEPSDLNTGFTTPITGTETAEMIGVVKFYRENGIITPEMSVITRDDPIFDTLTPDKSVTDVLDRASAELAVYTEKVVVKSPADYSYDEAHIRNNETPLGDLVSDAMKWQSGADIAFCNSGNIRAPLKTGDVTNGELAGLLPYANMVIKADVPGSVIRAALSHSANFYGMDNGGFMQVSGASYTFDITKPKYERIIEITVGGEPLDDEKIYSLATFDFIADGGDGYMMLTEYFQGKSEATGIITDIFINYLEQNTDFVTETNGRIVVKNGATGETANTGSLPTALIIAGIAVITVIIVLTVILLFKHKRSKNS
jgi:2',3'-cyclic-nucleotide 2'-phosphodiesterase (5'-nucleotidase family)